MKRIISVMLAILMTASAMLAGCTPAEKPAESTPNETPAETPAESTPEETPEPTEPESTPESTPAETEPEVVPVVNNFEKYRSNIAYGTGHNAMVVSENGGKELATYRAVFPVEEYGEFEYKLYFSNNMDASSRGFSNYPDMDTADYKIHYAALRTTSNIRGVSGLSDPVVITFDGNGTRNVKAGETFWSDAVTFNVPEGKYLVYEWTVEYTKIPGTIVASTYYSYKANTTADNFPKLPTGAGTAPMPDLIGCTRDGVRLTFIGDSITMGTGSGAYQHSFWVKQISERLGTGYCVWNLGLDSGRANDVIRGTSWKEKLKNTDILSICIGINDVMSIYGGSPQTGASATADDIVKSITQIAAMGEEAGAEIIIFTVPPFNLTGANLYKWQAVNRELKKLTEKKEYGFFDFAAVLGDPDDPAKCIYGDHPNKEGCTAVADAFMASGILEPKE
jgi:lysophospholipase L1-like esterase